jgi:hypothetical protein
MIFRYWLYCLFLMCALPKLYAQENSDTDFEIFRELLLSKKPIHQVTVSRFQGGKGAPFWPSDLKEIGNSYQTENHWVKTKQGLFFNPDGTGRLYQAYIEKENGKILFKRIDETTFAGYNFKSFFFDSNDTIYSIGGYGYWRINGMLRYYDSLKAGWEVKKLNHEIPIRFEGQIPYGQVKSIPSEGDSLLFLVFRENSAANNQEYLDSFHSFDSTSFLIGSLNIKSGNWITLGYLNEKNLKFFELLGSLISLPFGEIATNDWNGQRGYYLLSFIENKIYQISQQKEYILKSWFHDSKWLQNPLLYQVAYSSDSTLVFIREDLKRLELNLTKSDFIDTGMKIYEPVSSVSEASINLWHYAPLALGFILSGAALVAIYKQRRSRIGIIGQPIVSKFTAQELELMQFLSEQPEHTATTEELNTLLGTTKKSTDVQKKVRSEITRAINERYLELTLDDEKLIHQVRLESDKRMVKYEIDYKKYQHLQSLLPAKK